MTPEEQLREVSFRVTRPRVAVLTEVSAHPHADVDTLTAQVRSRLGSVSTQTVHDVLRALADAELIARIEPAGSPARLEARVSDNHHHAGALLDRRRRAGKPRPLVRPAWFRAVRWSMVRWACELHSQDDDFGQAGTLVREIWNHALRAEFVANVTGHLLGGVKGEVLEKAFDYWKNVDADTGKLIEANVRAANGA